MRTAFVAAAAVLTPAPSALAQVPPDAKEQRAVPTRTTYSIRGGGNYQFSGTEFEAFEASSAIMVRHAFNEDVSLDLRLGYSFVNYNFDGAIDSIEDPWDQVHTLDGALTLNWDVMNDWTLFTGPLFELSREGSPELNDDAVVGGGVIGAMNRVDDDLTIGGGLGFMDQLQDNVRFFPVIVVDWQLTSDLRLTTTTSYLALGRTGFELIYSFDRNLDLAVGAGYRFRRFRLDNDGPAPEGVGEDKSVPIWARVTWRPRENINLTLHGGVVTGGRITIETAPGKTSDDDYDMALLFGVSASIRF